MSPSWVRLSRSRRYMSRWYSSIGLVPGDADDPADDSTFLETDEDEGDDVTDIIGGEREDEEDT